MYNRCDTDFNLDPHLVTFLATTPFFAEISRNIRKVPTRDIPTMAISFNMKTDELCLLWNPEFTAKMTDWQIRNVLTHEFYHVVFSHIQSRRKTPDRMWNIATDLAINSLILKTAKDHGMPTGFRRSDEAKGCLPRGCLMPGEWPLGPEGRELTKEEKDAAPIAALIAKFPKEKSSDYYFEHLAKEISKMKCPTCGKGFGESRQKNPNPGVTKSKPEEGEGEEKDQAQGQGQGQEGGNQPGGNSPGGENGEHQHGSGQGGCGGHGHEHGESCGGGGGDQHCPTCEGGGDGWLDSFDNHAGWDNVPDEQREYINARVRNIVEKAVNKADQHSDGWGNIPAEMREGIRRSVSNIVNWRSVLKQFVGHMIKGNRSTSIKRINRRYPYVHPGIQKGYTARLLIAIDMSGSVDNKMLEMFFAELGSLTKKVSVDILPFDCYADVKEVYTWKKGQAMSAQRTRIGGTDFNAPTNIVNDPQNRGRWDGMLIFTDGEAPAPMSSRVKRGWVLGQGQKMLFNTEELVIQLDDGKTFQGAWR